MTEEAVEPPYAEDPRLTAARKLHTYRCRTAKKLSDYDDARRELMATIVEINGGPIRF